MSALPLSPRRRRRILRAHQLRQRGASIRGIAQQLRAAPSTIHDDLRALEQHWQPIAQHATRDALTAQIADLQDDIALYRSAEPKDLNQQRHQRHELASLRRELRLTIAAIARLPTPESSPEDEPADYPDDELADKPTEHSRTTPNTTEHPQPPRPDTGPVPNPATEKISEQACLAANAASLSALSAAPASRTARTPAAARRKPAPHDHSRDLRRQIGQSAAAKTARQT